MADEPPDPIQGWTAKRRTALVLSILKGETSVAEAARQHGLTEGRERGKGVQSLVGCLWKMG